MKKTFFATGLAMIFATSVLAEEQGPVSIYEFLQQQVPAAKALKNESKEAVKQFCDSLGDLMQEMTLKYQDIKNANPEGTRLFMELIGADDLIVALQQIKREAPLGDEDSISLEEDFSGEEL